MSAILYTVLWLLCGALVLFRARYNIACFPYPHEWMRWADRVLAVALGPIGLVLSFLSFTPRRGKD